MKTLLIRAQARLDLLQIWIHIAEESIDAANLVGVALEEAILGLLEMPGKGHRRADVKDQRYRFFKVYSYIIAYHYDEKTLTITRVIHGHRNFRKLFRRKR